MSNIAFNWWRDQMLEIARRKKTIENMPDGPEKTAAQAEYDQDIQSLKDDPISTALDMGREDIETFIEEAPSFIANTTLDVVRGLGGAIVDGLDGAYDAAAAKLSGREPDVVAGIVVVSLTILTGLYLFHSAKAARDAF